MALFLSSFSHLLVLRLELDKHALPTEGYLPLKDQISSPPRKGSSFPPLRAPIIRKKYSHVRGCSSPLRNNTILFPSLMERILDVVRGRRPSSPLGFATELFLFSLWRNSYPPSSMFLAFFLACRQALSPRSRCWSFPASEKFFR